MTIKTDLQVKWGKVSKDYQDHVDELYTEKRQICNIIFVQCTPLPKLLQRGHTEYFNSNFWVSYEQRCILL